MVLGILVQERRKQAAAETFPRRLVEAYPDAPRVGVTGRRASYAPAIKQVLPQAEHRQHTGPNDRADTRTGRRGDGNGRCAASSRWGKRSGPWSDSGRSADPSVRVAIAGQGATTSRSWARVWRSGGT